MSIVAGIGALKTATDMARLLRDRLKSEKVTPDEIAGRIGEIYDYIVDSKDALVDAKDEVHNLREKLRAAEGQLRAADDFTEFRASLTYRERDAVWLRKVDGVVEGYCGACLNEGKKVRLRFDADQYHCQYHGWLG